MTDMEQTEHAAAELLAAGFTTSGGPSGSGSRPEVPEAKPAHPPLLSPAPLPSILTPHSGPGTTPQGASTPTFASPPAAAAAHPVLSSPRSRHGPLPASPRPRGSRSMMPVGGPGASGLHPVVRLGWRSLCSVVCNGLRGEFLGGHDRDMFIQVTSGHYAGLPLVDVSLGGCIMTCSQFERCAGRELSKKWKESIHVVGEGEGSRATLLSWLKRQAEAQYGTAVVGQKVWVCWCADAEYYQGTIVAFNREGGKHTVQYSARLAEDLHLPVELISFAAEKPAVPPPAGPAASAPPAMAEDVGTAATAPAPTAAAVLHGVNPLWHQGSGVSVTSSYGEEFRGNAALAGLTTVSRSGMRAGQRRSRAAARLVDDVAAAAAAAADMGPPPKRALSAPAAVLLAEAAAAAAAMEEETQAGGGSGSQPMSMMSGGPSAPLSHILTVSPLTPGRPLTQAQVQQQQAFVGTLQAGIAAAAAASQLPLPALQIPLPPPPPGAGGGSPEALAAAVGWMHDVALALDTDLGSSADAGPSSGADEPPPRLSASGRFQALLGLLRATPACLEGLYDAMTRRYDYFSGTPALQRAKMADLLAATVAEAAAPRALFPAPARPPSPASPSLLAVTAAGHGGKAEEFAGGLHGALNAAPAPMSSTDTPVGQALTASPAST